MEAKELKFHEPPAIQMSSELIDTFIAAYFESDSWASFRAGMRDKTHTLNSDQLSYRIINHWHNEGLLSDLRPSGKGWRKYSLIDRVWVEVVIELRKYGYPLEWIRKIKDAFEKVEGDNTYMPFLEAYFIIAFYFKEPSYILVYPEGSVAMAISDEYNLSGDLSEADSFITINLNRLIQRIFPEKDLTAKFKSIVNLTAEELELLLFVRTGNFDSITVKRKNGKIDVLEGSEALSANTQLSEILRAQDYQNIEIKISEGKTKCIRRTVRKKV